MEFEEKQKKFEKIEWSKTQKKIIELIRSGVNFYEIAEKLNANTRTLTIHLNNIYNRTASIIEYTTFRKFAKLQFFLTELNNNKTPYRDVRKLIHPCATTPVNDPVNTPEHSYEVLAKENAELKAKLNVLESNRRIDFSELKMKIKTEIEKMTQKLMLIEEMERMIDNEDDSRTTNPEGTGSL